MLDETGIERSIKWELLILISVRSKRKFEGKDKIEATHDAEECCILGPKEPRVGWVKLWILVVRKARVGHLPENDE
jgi:hypothetical protein